MRHSACFLQWEGTLHERPAANLQVLVCLVDTGEEIGALEKDGSLVRLTRKAVCCLSGKILCLHRTGDLSTMSKYLRWDKGDVIFMVVRILKVEADIWHVAIRGSRKFATDATADVFNSYFTEYAALSEKICSMKPLAFGSDLTPKRRRTSLALDSDSRSEFTPRTFEGTPLKYNTL